MDSVDSNVFFVEQFSNEPSPQRNNSSDPLNLTELSGTFARETPTISSVVSPDQDIVTLDDDLNDPTSPYRFGAQQPIVPPSLNDPNLPPNPFYILAAMTVFQQDPTQQDDNYSPQSPDPPNSSPISAPAMSSSTIDGWETPHTITDNNSSKSVS